MTSSIPSTIAIDGPAASGKSTIGYYLAGRLGYLYLDTGVLYRAVTWAALDRGIPIDAESLIVELAQRLDIEVDAPSSDDGRQYTIRVDGCDVTWQIREPAVDQAVSPVSAYVGVRKALTRRMREIARNGRVVMVGRDIGTVVIPDAELKLFVVASAEARARRRCAESQAKGISVSYDEVLANIKRRDEIDSSREAAPLRAAPDAVVFDNTSDSIQGMYRRIDILVSEHSNSSPCQCVDEPDPQLHSPRRSDS